MVSFREATENLRRAAEVLKHSSPPEWDEFLKAFETYDLAITVAVTRAGPDTILNAQGAAQQCQSLLKVFAECEKPEPVPDHPARA